MSENTNLKIALDNASDLFNNNNLNECYKKICSLIQAEIKNFSKDYDKNLIRKHVETLTS